MRLIHSGCNQEFPCHRLLALVLLHPFVLSIPFVVVYVELIPTLLLHYSKYQSCWHKRRQCQTAFQYQSYCGESQRPMISQRHIVTSWSSLRRAGSSAYSCSLATLDISRSAKNAAVISSGSNWSPSTLPAIIRAPTASRASSSFASSDFYSHASESKWGSRALDTAPWMSIALDYGAFWKSSEREREVSVQCCLCGRRETNVGQT